MRGVLANCRRSSLPTDLVLCMKDVDESSDTEFTKVEKRSSSSADRKKVEIQNPRAITMKNKRPATQGVCPRCGTKVFRIGK